MAGEDEEKRSTYLEDSGGLVSKLGEAGGQRGGGSPPLQVQHPKVLKRPEAGDCFDFFHLIVLQLAQDGVELDPGLVELVLQHIGPLEAGRGHSHNGSFLCELGLLSSSLTFLCI